MSTPKILAFAASNRKGSFNESLIHYPIQGAQEAGATVTHIHLANFELPLYDANLEASQGLPQNALKLKELFTQHDALLIASPEHNSSLSPLLKNTLDWVSRPASQDEPPLSAYKHKTAAIISASPGALGGMRGLTHLRSILSSIGVLTLTEEKSLPSAHNAFDDSGKLIDDKKADAFINIGKNLASFLINGAKGRI